MEKRKALIIEDDLEQARHVVEALEAIGFLCDTIMDGGRGYECARTGSYDVAIIDNLLPRLSGEEIVSRLRAGGSRLPIIILSALGSEAHFINGLHNGADDYMSKPCSFGELQARVEALLRRIAYARGELEEEDPIIYRDFIINTAVRRVTRRGRLISLTPMEYSLFEYLVRNRGRLLPAQLIVDQVWGFDAGTSRNLMPMRLSSLRRKLTMRGEVDPVVTKRGFGYGLL